MSAHVSAAHAARMYGRSEKTVRRWIAAGKLPAEKVDGAYLVDLEDVARLVSDVSAQVSAPAADSVSTQGADIGVRTDDGDVRPPERPSVLAQAEAITGLIQATIGTVLAPLVAEQAALRQVVERQADQLVNQAEALGRLTAERDAARADADGLRAAQERQSAAEPAPVAPAASTAFSALPGPWRLAVLALVAAVAAMAVLLVWPG